MAEYTSDTIVEYEGLDHVRAVPKAYIKSSDNTGIIHTVWEYIANSVDEVGMNPNGGTIFVCLLRNQATNQFQFIIRDGARGIPAEKLLSALTKIGASGKISNKTAYRASGGQLGMGAKAAAALSSKYRVLSRNYLEDRVGSVSLADGKVLDHSSTPMNYSSGVIATFELDIAKFFADSDNFSRVGYLDLVKLLQQLNIFNPHIDFKFYIFDRIMPDEYWDCPIPDALGIVDNLLYNADREVVYDSATVPDKSVYLFEIWRVNSSIVYSDTFDKPIADGDKLSFGIKLYFTKKSSTGSSQYFVAVNNVYLVEKNNDPALAFLNIMRSELAKYQPTPEYRSFVEQNYTFPTLLLAIDVKYDGAKFSGVTKTNFKDAEFVKQFTADVVKLIKSSKGDNYWEQVNTALADDIQYQYSRYYDVPLKKSETRKVFMGLHYPQNFHECWSSDSSKCELYLVEGTSAGNIAKTRDNNYQAIYETRGKPFNAATNFNSLTENRRKLLKYDIYQDLSMILNISPSTTDMSTARFSKIIIATDADPDGLHISTIHINNLNILNPRIISSGMVWIARPPLYSMEISKSKFIFMRDKQALADTRIEYFYRPVFSLSAFNEKGEYALDGELFREAIYLVKEIGDKYNLVAKQLNIPITIVERLVYALPYIYPKIDYVKLTNCFTSGDDMRKVRINSDKDRQMLVISIGMHDYQVSLVRVGTMLIQYVLPILKKYRMANIYYKIKTKLPGSVYYDTPCVASLATLYNFIHSIDESMSNVRIHRYKGLGEMPTDSCYHTLMDPATRSITQITSVGDLEECYHLLGTDTTYRKQLLAGSTALSNTFLKKNDLLAKN